MLTALILAALLSLPAQSPDRAVGGQVVATMPGAFLLRDHGATVLPQTCPPSWCHGVKVGDWLFVDTVGADTEVIEWTTEF